MEIMGILNLTENSFLERSRMGRKSVDDIVAAVTGMMRDGADIIDIGACSSAPGNSLVSEEQEWERMKEAVPEIMRCFPQARLSFDTFRSGIVTRVLREARACNFHGQIIINDIFAAEADPAMLNMIADEGLCYIPMDHSDDPYTFYEGLAPRLDALGIKDWIVDPGFGFGKTVERNWEIFEELPRLHDFGRPVLAALSHKRMIYMPLGLTSATCTQQSVAAEKRAASLGADIVRTHDIALLRKA